MSVPWRPADMALTECGKHPEHPAGNVALFHLLLPKYGYQLGAESAARDSQASALARAGSHMGATKSLGETAARREAAA